MLRSLSSKVAGKPITQQFKHVCTMNKFNTCHTSYLQNTTQETFGKGHNVSDKDIKQFYYLRNT